LRNTTRLISACTDKNGHPEPAVRKSSPERKVGARTGAS
jgi:hypothetical protein